MNIFINSAKLKSESGINEYIEYRIGFAFSRTRRFIRAIEVALTDINGPKGGIDQQCKIIVQPYASPTIVIMERQSKIKHAVDRSITRASRNLSQQIKRKKFLSQQQVLHHSLQLLP